MMIKLEGGLGKPDEQSECGIGVREKGRDHDAEVDTVDTGGAGGGFRDRAGGMR